MSGLDIKQALLDEFGSPSEFYASFMTYVDFSKTSLYICAASILFNPTFWNIVARLEYNTHFLTKLAGGAKKGCYALAVTIFSLGILRDFLYEQALRDQPYCARLDIPPTKMLAAVLFGYGNILVLSSMYALGVTGTYLGDYFGILMDDRVTGFPFNITDNPMYYGSFLSFLGTALWFSKPAGILLSLVVLVMYLIALRFEEPFTAEIYAKRERERAAAADGKKSK
ncbi:phospholipid methyltransferase-domain-containing protein [Kockiozyma suomiensis]|uniref:phospholipid methyltransferase-domain-containing protein n=1 Tax=Kockiozyma suomiensis TaxID=1337062 RepID=UPI0033435BF5